MPRHSVSLSLSLSASRDWHNSYWFRHNLIPIQCKQNPQRNCNAATLHKIGHVFIGRPDPPPMAQPKKNVDKIQVWCENGLQQLFGTLDPLTPTRRFHCANIGAAHGAHSAAIWWSSRETFIQHHLLWVMSAQISAQSRKKKRQDSPKMWKRYEKKSSHLRGSWENVDSWILMDSWSQEAELHLSGSLNVPFKRHQTAWLQAVAACPLS